MEDDIVADESSKSIHKELPEEVELKNGRDQHMSIA